LGGFSATTHFGGALGFFYLFTFATDFIVDSTLAYDLLKG
jgi:hypothetical protein